MRHRRNGRRRGRVRGELCIMPDQAVSQTEGKQGNNRLLPLSLHRGSQPKCRPVGQSLAAAHDCAVAGPSPRFYPGMTRSAIGPSGLLRSYLRSPVFWCSYCETRRNRLRMSKPGSDRPFIMSYPTRVTKHRMFDVVVKSIAVANTIEAKASC